MDEPVLVELIADPRVTRLMSVRSYQYNTNKWRKVGEQPVQEPVKKKDDVVPAAVESEFAKIEERPSDSEPQVLLAGLRAQYEALTGKKADGRWNVARLNEKIKENEAK